MRKKLPPTGPWFDPRILDQLDDCEFYLVETEKIRYEHDITPIDYHYDLLLAECNDKDLMGFWVNTYDFERDEVNDYHVNETNDFVNDVGLRITRCAKINYVYEEENNEKD